MTAVNNLASRRVLEKIGMKYIETFNYDGDPTWTTRGAPTTWYEYQPLSQISEKLIPS
jgi:RimJ/RimL family protein N-acetyltransferase